MAKEFIGQLIVNIETEIDVSDEKFEKFRKQYLKMVDQWQDQLFDLAHKNGFEITNMYPLMEDEDWKLEKVCDDDIDQSIVFQS